MWGLAKLEKDDIESIKSLEEELGVNLLAFLDYEIEIADLSEKELNKIKDLEDNLGVSLVAVKKEE